MIKTRNDLRSDKEEFMPQALSLGPSKHKKSNVKLASVPEVLQLEAMQKMGVELCGLNVADLTEEKLLQPRSTS